MFRLTAGAHTCVRFDRHAVYLGTPSTTQHCPADPLGRTEAILVSPQAGQPAAAASSSSLLPSAAAANAGRSAVRIVAASNHVVVTATWGHNPGLIRRALSIGSLRSPGAPPGAQFTVHRAAAVIARQRPAAQPGRHARTADRSQASIAAVPSIPGGVFTGLGFDACQTPSQTTMTGWLQSPFRAAGIYIGGANMACSQPNLTATWMSAQTAAGWHIIPIYVGLQAPTNSCGCAPISTTVAAAQGSAAAADAVTSAEAIGVGPGNPIYDDMEAYNRTVANTTAVLAYLGAWTATLHADGYVSGVYSSDSSGILDLVAQYGTAFPEPDDLWVANWNGSQSTIDANIPATEWANHQRLHQYLGGHNDTYGGATLNVDSDYVDAATAAAGTGSGAPPVAGPPPAPSLSITPTPNGTLQMTPSWTGQTGIGYWQLEGGDSPTSLTPIGRRINATRTTPINVRNSYAYYQVLALDPTGQTLGTSATIPTPAHVAMFGLNAYVPRQGPGGVPVACFESQSCRVTVKIHSGKRTVSNTGPESIAAGGGIAHFKLSNYWHKLIAGRKPLPVTITIASTLAGRTSQAMKLVPYKTTGPRPAQSGTPSSQIRLVGGMEFVSHGWTGGVLAACVSTAPCLASTTIVAGGKVIARTNPQLLGAGMVGYLHFSLTRPGHLLLAKTASNQLSVRVQVSSQAGGAADGASASSVSVASGQVTLAAF